MAEYLLIESRSPWESGSVPAFYGLARDLAGAGHDVTLYLVQNAVLAARAGAQDLGLDGVGKRVRVLADDFSLRERAMGASPLRPHVKPAAIEIVVDMLARGARAAWH